MARLFASSTSAIGLLRILLAASVLVPAGLFGLVSWLNYKATVADAFNDLERTSEVAREHAERILESQTLLAERVNDLTRDVDAASLWSDEMAWHNTLNRMTARLPHVLSVLIASSAGKPLASAEVYPVPSDMDLRKRDFFQAVVKDGKTFFISSLQVGPSLQQPFFGVARPWLSGDDRLKGVINVAVSPAYFQDFYQALVDEGMTPSTGKVVAMLRPDGQILVRYPQLASPVLVAKAPDVFRAAIERSPESGLYKTRSVIDPDSPLRLFSYRKVGSYPLYVAAGQSWDAIMADWRETVLEHLLFGAPATLLLFVVAWTALVRTVREEQALQRANLEIARREAAEEALLRAQRLEAVGQMTGGVAHDFNNLLTVITGNAALIERRAENTEATRRFASSIILAAKRGADITHQLLAFAGRQTIRPETVDVNTRLQAFSPLLERAVNEAIPIVLDQDSSVPPVCVDAGQFESAILNLVGNARDAMPDGGIITIRTRHDRLTEGERAGPGVAITVADTGSGMDKDTLARAFEPFFTTKETGKGTGLGLSQVYGFARQAGGTARITSEPGRGTSVSIILPASPAPVMPESDDRIRGPQPGSPATTVLVEEDEPDVRQMAVETLEDLGYGTIAATDAKAALARLRHTGRVDVLFTDMVMPGGMNGLQLAAEAKRLYPDLKVLLTSGYTRLSETALPQDVRLLPKPYDRDGLSAELEAVLEA